MENTQIVRKKILSEDILYKVLSRFSWEIIQIEEGWNMKIYFFDTSEYIEISIDEMIYLEEVLRFGKRGELQELIKTYEKYIDKNKNQAKILEYRLSRIRLKEKKEG